MPETAYIVTTRWGGLEVEPPPSQLAEILAELDADDKEHPSTWLTHIDSNWSLSMGQDNSAYLHNDESQVVGHMLDVSRKAGLDLWIRFADDGPDGVKSDPWIPGAPFQSAEELEEIRAEAAAASLENRRDFFDQLGAEDATRPCKKPGCTSGRIQYSVFCKVHHCEQLFNAARH